MTRMSLYDWLQCDSVTPCYTQLRLVSPMPFLLSQILDAGQCLGRDNTSSHLCHVGYQVCALFLFLEACENHLGSRNVLLGVDQILKHVLVRPHNAGTLVGLRIGKAIICARCAAVDAPKRWALLGVATLFDGVALETFCLEELCTFLHIAILRDHTVRLCSGHGFLVSRQDHGTDRCCKCALEPT